MFRCTYVHITIGSLLGRLPQQNHFFPNLFKHRRRLPYMLIPGQRTPNSHPHTKRPLQIRLDYERLCRPLLQSLEELPVELIEVRVGVVFDLGACETEND